MNGIKFATFRLGKTSIQDIQTLDKRAAGIQTDSYSFVVTCTQVPDDLTIGTVVFVWLGSDNSKGMPTEWKQGFKGLGVVKDLDKAPKYNDESHTTIELRYVFGEAVNRLDILRESPVAYFWCSALPIIGLDDHSNQTVRVLAETSDRSKIGAFLYALNAVHPTFRAEIVTVIPDMADCFWDGVNDPKTGASVGRMGQVSEVTSVRQLITYGAPGTGKSFKTKNETKGETVFRTTFHPDSDYATFVGAYKPTMKDDRVAYTEVSRKESSGAFGVVEKREQKFGICYKFVDQVFTKAYTAAWKYQKAAGAGVAPKKVYLIIEEINRGNCAQVFGDLFQLLDRNPQGFSEYGVIPDADFGKHIGEELAKEASVIDPTRKSQINALYPEIESGVDLVDEVLAGRMLLFPDNLYIRATMNTSDQSLFPIDSAFKRRWEWEYVPIEDAGKGWKIGIGGVQYKWWSFLEKINDVIATETSSEDKQLGYFFVKAKDGVIDAKTFVSKVIFYLWGDVFKDNLPDDGENGDAFKYTFTKDGKANKRHIRFADFYHPETGNTKDQWRDKLLTSFLGALKVEESSPAANTSGAPNVPAQGSSTADGGVATANE